MKTTRILLLTGLLALGTSFLSAGPGAQFWNPPTTHATVAAPAASQTPAPAMACAAMSSCACCKKA